MANSWTGKKRLDTPAIPNKAIPGKKGSSDSPKTLPGDTSTNYWTPKSKP